MDDNASLSREERIALLSSLYSQKNKFAAKLTFEQRCEILALHRIGITREAVASMYNIDRRTVTHICNPLSKHYKKVREMETGLGTDRFRETYLNDETINKALAFRQEAEKSVEVNNKFAKTKAGVHVVKGKNCQLEHRVIVAWKDKDDDIEVPGWYYKDLDSDFPDNWFCTGDDSLKTSHACYVAMLSDITDKVNDT
jgi:hypothetical protein